MVDKVLTAAAAFVCLGMGVAHAATTAEIGTTVVVKSQVTAEFEAEKRKLEKGGKLHQNETVETAKAASAEILLLDETKLAVGPSARIVLDKFVYDAGAAPGAISVNLAKGAFRFISGSNASTAYEIKTPTASVGVRGTVFDVYVAADGETAVLLHDGAVDVCSRPANCRRHDTAGRIIHVNLQGVLSAPIKWDGTFMKGIGLGVAFPFVGKRLAIDPIRRLRHADVLGKAAGVGGPARAVTKPVEKFGRGPGGGIPKPRLPF